MKKTLKNLHISQKSSTFALTKVQRYEAIGNQKGYRQPVTGGWL